MTEPVSYVPASVVENATPTQLLQPVAPVQVQTQVPTQVPTQVSTPVQVKSATQVPARPIPTPPSTQQQQPVRRNSIGAIATPVLGAAAAAAGVQAQKALAEKCPHCQSFLAQAQGKDWNGLLNNATRVLAPVVSKAAGETFGQLKSRIGLLSTINKII